MTTDTNPHWLREFVKEVDREFDRGDVRAGQALSILEDLEVARGS